MAHKKPFKKDLTPIGRKGRVDTHTGKGATEQRTRSRERETLTGGTPMARAMNTYPSAPPAPPSPRPEDLTPMATAMMPPKFG